MRSTLTEVAPPSVQTDAEPKVVTLVFTDLVGSTDMTERLGDRKASDLNDRHDRVARELIRRYDGREVKKSDGFMFLFERPIDAVCFALAFHDELKELSSEVGESLLARVGIHMGEVYIKDNVADDVRRGAPQLSVEGLAVPLAARIMSLGEGGQTLIEESATKLARRAAKSEDFGDGVAWMEHGEYLLKGISEPVTVCEVGWKGRAPFRAPKGSEDGKVTGPLPVQEEKVREWLPAVGSSVPGRDGWILRKSLGEGGFGETWLATKDRIGERAFKFCLNAERVRSLKREFSLVKRIREKLPNRPDIVPILDYKLDVAPYFLELEYTAGGDLADWSQSKGGLATLPLARRLELVAQVAGAVHAAHSVGIIHKDVKPTNILIQENKDGSLQARLTDFGIGELDRSKFTGTTGPLTGFTTTELPGPDLASRTGTRMYAAPELVEGKDASIQTDVYALGVLLYQMVVGDLNRMLAQGWEAEVQGALSGLTGIDSIHVELLCADIAACVAYRSEQRLSSADELARRLRNLEDRRRQRLGELERTRRELERKQAYDRLRRRTWFASLSVLALAGIGALFVQRMFLARTTAKDILSTFVHDVSYALVRVDKASWLDRHYLKAAVGDTLVSDAYTKRIEGARAGIWIHSDMFWKSVQSDGQLWKHGEWLELADILRPPDHAIPLSEKSLLFLMDEWKDKVERGDDSQKYVALCLIGQLAVENKKHKGPVVSPERCDELKDLCENTAQSAKNSGVRSAAWWAARRLGSAMDYPAASNDSEGGSFADPISGLIFVRVPAPEVGSPFDQNNSSDSGGGGGVSSQSPSRSGFIFFSITEVTCGSFAAFASHPEVRLEAGWFDANARTVLSECRNQPGETNGTGPCAMGQISYDAALAYVKFLNDRSRGAGRWIRYRLPTADDWEHACAAGNAGSYCFGDDVRYAPYFGRCNGDKNRCHRVADFMPNAFGLFDMHGGLWEWTDTTPSVELLQSLAVSPEKEAEYRLLKGGAFYSPAKYCATRLRAKPESTRARSDFYNGIRLVAYDARN